MTIAVDLGRKASKQKQQHIMAGYDLVFVSFSQIFDVMQSAVCSFEMQS